MRIRGVGIVESWYLCHLNGDIMERYENPSQGDILYFTDGLITNQRTLTILTVLFDRVFTYYLDPNYYASEIEQRFEKLKTMDFQLYKINNDGNKTNEDTWSILHKETASTHLKKSVLVFWEENHYLRNEGILLPIGYSNSPKDWNSAKEFLESDIGKKFYNAADWAKANQLIPNGKSYVDAGFFIVHRLTQASTGLWFGITHGMIPFADHPILADIAYSLINNDFPSIAKVRQKELGVLLASKAVSYLIPQFGSLNQEEILEVRHRTLDERKAFTSAMTRLSLSLPEIDNYNEAQQQIKIIIQKELEPAINDLRNRIMGERKALFRKISVEIGLTAAGLPVAMQTFNINPLSSVLAGMALLLKCLADIHAYETNIEIAKNESQYRGLALILDLNKLCKKKFRTDSLNTGIHPILTCKL